MRVFTYISACIVNASRQCNSTLEINTNTKIAKGPWTTGQKKEQTYYTATQEILTHGLGPHALRTITGRANDRQKATQTTEQRYRETDRVKDGWMDRQTDIPTDGQTDRPTDGRTDGQTDRPTNQPTEEPMVVPTDQPTDGTTNRRTNKQMGGWIDRPTDQPTDRPMG